MRSGHKEDGTAQQRRGEDKEERKRRGRREVNTKNNFSVRNGLLWLPISVNAHLCLCASVYSAGSQSVIELLFLSVCLFI